MYGFKVHVEEKAKALRSHSLEAIIRSLELKARSSKAFTHHHTKQNARICVCMYVFMQKEKEVAVAEMMPAVVS